MVQRWLIHSLASKLIPQFDVSFCHPLAVIIPAKGNGHKAATTAFESDSIHDVSARGEMLQELVIHK